jgi:class 3 adenylate cyclase/CHASE2 domain-containing sensor protein
MTAIGLALIVLVLVFQMNGTIDPQERWLSDIRVRWCQVSKPPTPDLVHIDVDDEGIRTMGQDPAVGQWPWPRQVVGELVDVLHAAGAKLVLIDMIFSEPGRSSLSDKTSNGDQILADAMHRSGNVLLPVTFHYEPPVDKPALQAAIEKELIDNVELNTEQILFRLKKAGLPNAEKDPQFLDYVVLGRQQVLRDKIDREMDMDEEADPATLRPRLLPRTYERQTESPLNDELAAQWALVRRDRALRRFELPMPGGVPPLLHVADEQSPIYTIATEAAGTGFSDFLPDPDGFCRRIPLFVEHEGRLCPNLGITLACAMLGAELKDVRISKRSVVIPARDGKQYSIPVQSYHSEKFGEIGLICEIPWFGVRDSWQTMYDYPSRRRTTQHISVIKLWDLHVARRTIQKNLQGARKALGELSGELGLNSDLLALADDQVVGQVRDAVRLARSRMPDLESMRENTPEWEAASEFRSRVMTLELFLRVDPQLRNELQQREQELSAAVHNKSVLIGWVATGIGDFNPTPLDAKCPGVVGHSTLVNGILTGSFSRPLPMWTTYFATVLVGLLSIVILIRVSQAAAFTSVAGMAIGYMLFDGYFLFHFRQLELSLAAPLICIAMVYTILTLVSFVFESTARRMITARFTRYIDPALVEYILNNPSQHALPGEQREVTVGFTDLAGFTELTEQLREGIVGLLNEYMNEMVPVIRRNHGYVNKFLGDGIMFFFGAPAENPQHAADGVAAMIEMQLAMEGFNARMTEVGFPPLSFRGGMTTGQMIVGDAGPDEGGDYTVLGDVVNLASRLQSANKFFGSKILINARTAESVQEQFLLRPIGRIQVMGKKEGITVYEPLARLSDATPEQKRLADLTRAMVESFMKKDLAGCAEALAQMEGEAGASPLTRMYRDLCGKYGAEVVEGEFTGEIALAEK